MKRDRDEHLAQLVKARAARRPRLPGARRPKGAPPNALTAVGFAKRCGISRAALYLWLEEGRFPPRGRTRSGMPYWLPADVEAFLASPIGRRRETQRTAAFAKAMRKCAKRLLTNSGS
jgi:predicted DNA-binding transcriptional regulator AlpA